MKPFGLTSPAVMHCGEGTFVNVAAEASRLGDRVVIVTGGHLHGTLTIAGLQHELRNAGIEAMVAHPITSEPTVDMVDELAAFARGHDAKVIVAVGGGSVMDTAKAAALMVTNDGPTEDYQLRRRQIANAPIGQVFAPTTAGTGSEATQVAVLTNPRERIKRSISHSLMTPDAVVLDPELTMSCSLYLTTLTALDAFSHAIESAVSTSANAYTRGLALAAIEQLSTGLPRAQSNPRDLEARLSCLMGACLAGLAMQAGLGASHSLAPAVCIVGGMRHSEAVGALLPHAIRLNQIGRPRLYEHVRQAMGCDDVAAQLEQFAKRGEFECNLTRFGMKLLDWQNVQSVMDRYASHRQTNPTEVTDDYARKLFGAAVVVF